MLSMETTAQPTDQVLYYFSQGPFDTVTTYKVLQGGLVKVTCQDYDRGMPCEADIIGFSREQLVEMIEALDEAEQDR